MDTKRIRISIISKLNFIRLFYRGTLLLGLLVYYILFRIYNIPFFDFSNPITLVVVGFITLSFVGEMIERFIPSKTASMGSQKQHERNYRPSGEEKPVLQSWKATLLVATSWIGLNAIFGTLYYLNIIDQGLLMLISITYSVCDMICILYFCPFQTWMMHNRCCTTCRIYNWDFAMMFTPIVFIMVTKNDSGYIFNPFAIILVVTALALLIKWEVVFRLHPERFSDTTNLSIRCENCQEKLCSHKKQLQRLLKKSRELLKQKLNIKDKENNL
ncbi:MAG: hypothetical protein E7178_06445 [Erysipelotrichaceae bacterium]|nr:hypothetical protein [Erysipelotrichaceae bacterium]